MHVSVLEAAGGHEFLATRALAASIREHIEGELAETNHVERVYLDFSHVEATTGGFMDELLGKLVTQYGARFVVVGANGFVAETIGTVMERRSL